MNTAPNFAKRLILRGKLNIELIPAKDWRENAAKGVRRMTYRISADAEVDGQILHVNAHIPGVRDGQIVGLGAAVPPGGTEAVEIISSLGPKNNPRLNCLEVLTDANGSSVIGEDGLPAYAPGQDIPEGYAPFGTAYFCPSHGGLTLALNDASITPTDRADPSGAPFYDVGCLSYEVIPAEHARAAGAPLVKFTAVRQAARKSGTAAPAQAVTADIRM